MNTKIIDPKLIAAAHRRLTEEADELHLAVASLSPSHILDEVADVLYYLRKVAEAANITDDCIRRYSAVKSAFREAGVRNKNLELRFADEFINESQFSEF